MSDEDIRRAQESARDVLKRLARDRESAVLNHGWTAEGGGDSMKSRVLTEMTHQVALVSALTSFFRAVPAGVVLPAL